MVYKSVSHFLLIFLFPPHKKYKQIILLFFTIIKDILPEHNKTNVFYKGKYHEAYLSHVKVQITASRKNIYLVLVYSITEHPMMPAANKEIKSKEDVVKVAKIYFSHWNFPTL